MADTVQNFDRDPSSSSFMGGMRNYGNPMVNILAQMMTGYNYMPERQEGQNMYEAMIQRERSRQFMGLQRTAFANNPIFQNLGISGSSTLGMLGGMMASPDSLTGKAMSTALGGNPMAASMQLYAGLSGANTMGAFGRTSAITSGETAKTMQALAENFYTTRNYEGAGGTREKLKQSNQEFFEKQLSRGQEGISYLEKLGYKGLELDKDGKPTEATKKKIRDIDITAGPTESKETREQVAEDINKDISNILKETDKDIKKSLDERLEKQLIARKIATKKQLDAARDEQGVLDPAKLSGLISNYTEKGTESAEATRLRNQIAAKTLQAGDIASGIEEIKSSGKDKKTLKEANEKMEKMLITNDLVKPEEIKQYKNKDGSFDLEKIQKIREGLNRRTEDERRFMQASFEEERGSSFTNYDFKKSRGFKLEDFTSGFYKAAELRGLGESKNVPVAEAMRRFSNNAGGAMDAARSVFGNKSGAELISSMSELAGSSEMDLSTQEGSSKMEDLLRKVKATQKVAGVSIQTMLAVINSAKELAANNPQLQYMNSSATTESAMRAVSTAADMGRVMGGKDFRQAGGTQAIAADIIKEEQAFAQSGLGGSAIALMAASKGTKAYGTIQKMLKEGKFTGRDLDRGGMEQIAKEMGISVGEVAYIMQNEQLRQEGLKDEDITKSATAGAQKNAANSFFQSIQSVGLEKDDLVQKYKEAKARGESYEEFKNKNITPRLTADQQQLSRTYSKSIQKEFQDASRTEEERMEYDKLVEKQAQEDKEMSEKFAQYNAPVVQQAIGAMLTGAQYGLDAGSQAMAGIFATKDTYSAKTKEAVEKAQKAGARVLQMGGDIKGEEGLVTAGYVDELNEVRAGRAQTAMERGDTAAANLLSQKVSAEDLKSSIDVLKKTDLTDTKKAAARLADLRAQKEKGTIKDGSSEARQLAALEKAEIFLGGLKDDKAYSNYVSGGLRGAGAATIQAEATAGVTEITEEAKKQKIEQMGQQLELAAGQSIGAADKQEIEEAKKAYTNEQGEVDYAAMFEDFNDPTKKKGRGQTNFFADKYKAFDKKSADIKSTLSQMENADPETRKQLSEKLENDLMQRGFSAEELDARKQEDGTFSMSDAKELSKEAENRGRSRMDESTLRRELMQTQDKINIQKENETGKGNASPESTAQTEMVNVFRNLYNALTGENSISTTLQNLADSLKS
jgi:hypothetical protein